MEKRSDILIIGSGVAGLSTAINIAQQRPDLTIHVLSKVNKEETNTKYAQGGIATVWDFDLDNFEKHIDDTEDAGDGLCDPQVVKMVVEDGHQRVLDLIKWGANFDKDDDGDYNLGMEGGHSEYRILHYKDLTGAEVQRALLEKAKSFENLTIYEHYYAIDLITQHHLGWNVTRMTPGIECYGAYVLDINELDVEKHISKVTILASGGAGQIYQTTTNPSIATGDGIAMAYRAKCRISNMEFVQFHPSALWTPIRENPAFLISEAVRGFGAILKSRHGEPFMDKYDERGSLAPRDIVARAIDNELKVRGDDFVTLDCRHLDMKEFIEHFPTIYNKCLSLGIDPAKDLIPVVPACHYFCGGLDVDLDGQTSIQHLYACGECTSTGLHGANRLASNSLLEGLVYGHRIAQDVVGRIDEINFNDEVPNWNALGTTQPKEMVLITQSWKELKAIMSSYVGIVRSNVRLKRAMDRMWLLYQETEALYHSTQLSPQLCELRNLITIGYLVTRSAQMRKESRGLHFTTDYKNKKDVLEKTYL